MIDIREIVILGLKALAIAMVALSVIFNTLNLNDDYLYIVFLAVGVAVLSISSIVEHNKILYWEKGESISWL